MFAGGLLPGVNSRRTKHLQKSTLRIRTLLQFTPELIQNFRPPLAPKFTLQCFQSHRDHMIMVSARETWIGRNFQPKPVKQIEILVPETGCMRP